jgi:enamine deaminase RidA (YjgF/YER057c/UK114 family)
MKAAYHILLNNASLYVGVEVINGCSDLLVEVFGEIGKHARSAVGMQALPNGIPVEIEMILEVA